MPFSPLLLRCSSGVSKEPEVPGVEPLTALLDDHYAEPGDETLWTVHKRLAKLVG
jgi:hypothetical protein